MFKENDDFSAIIKAIVELESGNIAAPREAQLQSSGQDPFDQREGSRPSRRRSSQSVQYNDFAKEELQRPLECLIVASTSSCKPPTRYINVAETER